jgi:hypothetical protein
MTEQEKQELIEHCEKAIAAAKENIEAFKRLGNDSHGVIALLSKEVKVYQIALASLKAEPELWEIENPGEGSFYSPHGPREYEEVRAEWFTVPPIKTT